MEKKILIKDVCCALCAVVFVCLMGFLASRWSLLATYLKFGYIADCFSRGERMQDFIDFSVCAFKEEAIYRCLPILITTSIIMIVKPPVLKKISIVLSAIIIILVQLKFGYDHFHPELGCTDYWFYIRLQGGIGIILAGTYCLVFWLSMRRFYIGSKHPIISFLLCHVLAILASITVHAVNNCLVIIAQTF